jgi:hypothetical protein
MDKEDDMSESGSDSRYDYLKMVFGEVSKDLRDWVRGSWWGGLLTACAVWIVVVAAIAGLKAYSVRENGQQIRCLDCLMQFNDVQSAKLTGVVPETVDEWSIVQCAPQGQQTMCPDGSVAMQGSGGCACKGKRVKYYLVYVCERGHIQRVERAAQEVKSSGMK